MERGDIGFQQFRGDVCKLGGGDGGRKLVQVDAVCFEGLRIQTFLGPAEFQVGFDCCL